MECGEASVARAVIEAESEEYSEEGLALADRRRSGQETKDGNGSGSDQVESPCTQNRNLKSKPETETDSGGNPSPKPNPRIPETRMDIQNPRINIHIFICINKSQ